MLKMAFLGIPFLIGKAADFLQDGKVVAYGINRIAFLFRDEGLIVVYELFRQLSESQILDLVLGFDEHPECQPHIVIAGISPLCPVYADTCLNVVTDCICHFHEGHLCFHASLEKVFHIGGIEINLTLHKIVECRVYRQQQFLNSGIAFHRFLALAVQTAFTWIPQFRSAGQLATELRHTPVHGDSSHYRGFARLVRFALFKVEQHLEFFYFHTLILFSAKLLAI